MLKKKYEQHRATYRQLDQFPHFELRMENDIKRSSFYLWTILLFVSISIVFIFQISLFAQWNLSFIVPFE